MKKDLKSILKRLEAIEENQQGQLQGGFVAVHGITMSGFDRTKNKKSCHVTNNCEGGNCVPGCGSSL